MKTLLFTSLFLVLMVFSCEFIEIYKFARGVQEDTRRSFKTSKKKLFTVSFQGVVQDKKYCSTCNTNKYLIIIALQSLDSENNFLFGYPPYYEFVGTDTLKLAMNQKSYNMVTVGSGIVKAKNSNLLLQGNASIELLSNDTLKWFP
ncbi:MAG: hypothetical protein JNM36_14440 [Chitinophagales bacterium]|nr:hypothetical protein [Chitinophagales bacterium]